MQITLSKSNESKLRKYRKHLSEKLGFDISPTKVINMYAEKGLEEDLKKADNDTKPRN